MKTDKLEKTVKNLRLNNFEVFVVDDVDEAYNIFKDDIYSRLEPKSLSYADSVTMHKTRVLDLVKRDNDIDFIDTFNPNDSWKEQIKNRKKALCVDLFITGTNAITEAGQLVNLDMIGNRVSALTFGPRNVVLFVGVNKIVANLDDAFKRVKSIAAPLNAKAHESLILPCQKTGVCHDCHSPKRICNTWSITEKSYPKHRIKIVLINQSLGF